MFSDTSIITDYTVSCPVKIEVIKQTPFYYDLLWTYSKATICEDIVYGAPFRKELLSQNKNLEVIYRVDLNGVFIKLVNYSMIYRIFKEILSNILIKTGLSEIDDDIVAIKKTMERRQFIEQIHFPDIQLLHLPYNASYKRNNSYKQSIVQPQTYEMGIPLNGTEVIEHTEHDDLERLLILREYYQDISKQDVCKNIFTTDFFDAYKQYHKLSSLNFEGGETFKLSKEKNSSWVKDIKYGRINKQDKYYRRRKIELTRDCM